MVDNIVNIISFGGSDRADNEATTPSKKCDAV